MLGRRSIKARLIVALAIIAAAVSVSLASSATANDYFKGCGSKPGPGAGWYHVRAHHIGCDKAREVARHYWRTGDEHFRGWSCKSRQVGEEDFRARCHRDHNGRYQVVRFSYGS